MNSWSVPASGQMGRSEADATKALEQDFGIKSELQQPHGAVVKKPSPVVGKTWG